MKNDTTTTLLNFVLAIMIALGVVCAFFSTKWTHDAQMEAQRVGQVRAQFGEVQALITDVNNYNQQAKSPEISRMLQPLIPKPAGTK